MESKYPRPGEPVLSGCCTSRLTINDWCIFFHCTGNRRSRNRSRGQLLVKNPTATTLQFESDFDFETANAQFKDDLTKEVVGMLLFWNKYHCMMQLLRGTYTLCIVFFLFCYVFCELLQLKRWSPGRPRTARLHRRRRLWVINTTTKPNASLTTSRQTWSPGDDVTLLVMLIQGSVYSLQF